MPSCFLHKENHALDEWFKKPMAVRYNRIKRKGAGGKRNNKYKMKWSLSRNRTSGPCGAYLSCFGKKGTKEPTQGRMLTTKPFGSADRVDSFYPGFEPPSPENLSRPLRVSLALSGRLCPRLRRGGVCFRPLPVSLERSDRIRTWRTARTR